MNFEKQKRKNAGKILTSKRKAIILMSFCIGQQPNRTTTMSFISFKLKESFEYMCYKNVE